MVIPIFPGLEEAAQPFCEVPEPWVPAPLSWMKTARAAAVAALSAAALLVAPVGAQAATHRAASQSCTVRQHVGGALGSTVYTTTVRCGRWSYVFTTVIPNPDNF